MAYITPSGIGEWLASHFAAKIKQKDYSSAHAIFDLIIDFSKLHNLKSLKDEALKQAGIDTKAIELDKNIYPPLGEQVREVFENIDKLRGYRPPKRNAEASAIIRMLKKGYIPKQIVDCWHSLKQDKFWQDKELFLMTVESQIGAKINGIKETSLPNNLIFGQSLTYAKMIVRGQITVPEQRKHLFENELKRRGIQW